MSVFSMGTLFAQNSTGRVWVFGDYARVVVNGYPSAASAGTTPIYAFQGSASISDNSGNLQFYTDGLSVYDATGTAISGGNGTLYGSTDAQVMILKKPGSSDTYYVFTTPPDNSAPGYGQAYYSEVKHNGSVYQVTSANNALTTNQMSEHICIARSIYSDNEEYWVIYHSLTGDTFYAFRVTSSGVNTTPVTSTGNMSLNTGERIGFMKVSPCGERLAMTNSIGLSAEVLDFNHATGMVSPMASNAGMLTFDDDQEHPPLGDRPYGVEFSPTGRILYIATSEGPETYLYQYRFDVSPLQSSRKTVGSLNSSGRLFGALQLGYDGKIYIATHPSQIRLGIINSPDNYIFADYGTECGMDIATGVPLDTDTYCEQGLPMYTNDFFNQCCGLKFFYTFRHHPNPGEADGRIIVAAIGGTGNYQYQITGFATWQSSGNFNGLTSGIWEIRVRDTGTGCEINHRIELY